jgi:hypothetical protein
LSLLLNLDLPRFRRYGARPVVGADVLPGPSQFVGRYWPAKVIALSDVNALLA